MDDQEQHIRERAYALWEKEGCPDGRDLEFWERARGMIETEGRPSVETPLQQRSSLDATHDQALAETFPASDPPAATTPKPSGGKSRRAR